MKSSTFLLIDGENFLHKVKEVINVTHTTDSKKVNLSRINLKELIDKSLQEFDVSKKFFYAAKLHINPKTEKKSKRLIQQQRYLKTQLTKQGFEYVSVGNVRSQKVGTKIIFREKGVDVKIAIDMVSFAVDNEAKTIILCSSDSDLQPAVKEAKRRGIKVVYLGFAQNPNKGLIYTTDKKILFENTEILKVCGLK
jgi:uncharacterized LabA/DUF88 family protein